MKVAYLFLRWGGADAIPGAKERYCSEDSCLKAIIGHGISNRHGKNDCISNLAVTVTPKVKTVSVTKTVTVTPTALARITKTQTINVVRTTTISGTKTIIGDTTRTVFDDRTTTVTQTTGTVTITKTSVVDVMATVEDDITETITDFAIATITAGSGSGQAKEKERRGESCHTPDYARVCGGVEKYRSACACVGAQASTKTASARTITKTYTKTVHGKTKTVTKAVAIKTITKTTATSTIIRTLATVTQTSTVATITQTRVMTEFENIIATATATNEVDLTETVATEIKTLVTATVTEEVTTATTTVEVTTTTTTVEADPTGGIEVKATNQEDAWLYLLYADDQDTNAYMWTYTAGSSVYSDLVTFSRTDGYIKMITSFSKPATNGQYLYYSTDSTVFGPGGQSSYLVFTSESDAAAVGASRVTCTLGSGDQLTCNWGSGGSVAEFWYCNGNIVLAAAGLDPSSLCPNYGDLTQKINTVLIGTSYTGVAAITSAS